MDLAAQHGYAGGVREDKATARTITNGSIGEIIAGAGAIVLAIIGLAGASPAYLLSIAVIAAGAAMIFEGGSIASRLRAFLDDLGGANVTDVGAMGTGMTAEFLAGCAGVALGILSLIGIDPALLNPIAVIAMGGGLVLGSGVTARLNTFIATRHLEDFNLRAMTRDVLAASAGSQLLIGLGAVALGIIALVGLVPITLTEVGVLIIGAAVLLSGTAFGTLVQDAFRHA